MCSIKQFANYSIIILLLSAPVGVLADIRFSFDFGNGMGFSFGEQYRLASEEKRIIEIANYYGYKVYIPRYGRMICHKYSYRSGHNIEVHISYNKHGPQYYRAYVDNRSHDIFSQIFSQMFVADEIRDFIRDLKKEFGH